MKIVAMSDSNFESICQIFNGLQKGAVKLGPLLKSMLRDILSEIVVLPDTLDVVVKDFEGTIQGLEIHTDHDAAEVSLVQYLTDGGVLNPSETLDEWRDRDKSETDPDDAYSDSAIYGASIIVTKKEKKDDG